MDRRKIKTDKIKNCSTINEFLDKEYGEIGTESRNQFEQEALDFYASQIILLHRKDAHLTQKELSEKSGIDKSYISRIENGSIQPTVGTFIKLIRAMGLSMEIG